MISGRYPIKLPFRFSNLQNCLLNLVEPRGCFSYKFDYNAGEGRAEGPSIAAFKMGDPLHLRQVVRGLSSNRTFLVRHQSLEGPDSRISPRLKGRGRYEMAVNQNVHLFEEPNSSTTNSLLFWLTVRRRGLAGTGQILGECGLSLRPSTVAGG